MDDKRDELQAFHQNPNRTTAGLYAVCRPKFLRWGQENHRTGAHDLADLVFQDVLFADDLVVAIAFLLLTLERLRQDLRSGFAQAVSGTDLVVGARTGPVQLMLYAVFRVGGATNGIKTSSVQALAAHRPLGDVQRARKVVYFASQQGRGAV